MTTPDKFFYKSQRDWINDDSPLKIIVKSRQTGFSCRNWADLLKIGFKDKGETLLDPDTNSSAYVLQFANGRRIYSLSSNPNALAGKCGHVKIDEFALHKDQRLLYRVAKPDTTWA